MPRVDQGAASNRSGGALRLVSKAALVEATPWLSCWQLEWLLRNRDRNGLAAAGAVVRIGRSILIDQDRWAAWLEEQRET